MSRYKNRSYDTGCRFWDKCETCPHPDCIDGTKIKMVTLKRGVEVRELANKGHKTKQIAKELGVHIRTVQRHRKGGIRK